MAGTCLILRKEANDFQMGGCLNMDVQKAICCVREGMGVDMFLLIPLTILFLLIGLNLLIDCFIES